MAKKKKGPRQIVGLKSVETGHVTYVTSRNKRNRTDKGQGKLELLKYDPVVRRRVLHKEVEKLK